MLSIFVVLRYYTDISMLFFDIYAKAAARISQFSVIFFYFKVSRDYMRDLSILITTVLTSQLMGKNTPADSATSASATN